MTAAAAAALCTAAGLQVLAVDVVGRVVTVRVAKVPESASGLAGLTARLGVGVTVCTGGEADAPTVSFVANGE